MHSYRPFFTLCDFEELINNIHGGDAAIWKVQFNMPNPLLNEVIRIVCFIIEPDYAGDLELLKDGHIIGGG